MRRGEASLQVAHGYSPEHCMHPDERVNDFGSDLEGWYLDFAQVTFDTGTFLPDGRHLLATDRTELRTFLLGGLCGGRSVLGLIEGL